MRRSVWIGGLVALLAVSSAARAAQPLATDDASVLDARTCQIETFIRAFDGGREAWLVPACNFTGSVEWSAGGAKVTQGGERSSHVQLQAKTVFVPRGDRQWSFGASVGAVRDTAAARGRSAYQTYYAKALASAYPSDEWQIDLNVGHGRTHGTGGYLLAASAVQYRVHERTQLLAEIVRDEPGRTKYQAGIRYIAIPNRFESYVSYGNRFGGDSRDWSAIIGVRLQTPMLP